MYNTEYGFTDILRFGEKFEAHAIDDVKQVHRRIFPGLGFDGEFYSSLALDPLLIHKDFKAAMDSPQYRSRRIFLPLCTYLVAHGNPVLSLNIYAISNFIFWIGLCILVFYKIRPRTLREYACMLMIIFSSGVIISVQFALTDMPSTVLLFAAVLFPFFWPALFCCGVLTRETTLIFTPVFLVMEMLHNKKALSIILKMVIALAPPFLWYCYCMWRFPESIFMDGIYGFPFLAMLHRLGSIVHHMPQTFYFSQMQFFLTAISLTAQCIYFFVRRRPTDPVWFVGVISAFFYAIMGHGPWMEWSWMLRYSLPMTFAFNLILSKEDPPRFLKWFFVGNIGCLYV